MIALVSVMGKASRSRWRKWANKVKGVVAERAEIIPGLTCRGAPPMSDDRDEVSESAAWLSRASILRCGCLDRT